MPTPRFSVVVPTFNRPLHVAGLLHALAALEVPEGGFETVVVNDGGPEPPAEDVAPLRDRLDLKWIRVSHRGPSAARQAGIDAAKGAYLAFTDDDCRPAPGWLVAFERAFAKDAGSAYGGRVVNDAPDDPYAATTHRVVEYVATPTRREWLRFLPTNNLAFPAGPFRAIGGLDASWTISGGEDRDLCARWIERGWRLTKIPDAVVRHEHRLSFAPFCRQHFHYGRGAFHFRRRHGRHAAGGRETAAFYAGLFRQGWAGTTFRERARGIALVAVSQAATAAGYWIEALRAPRRGAGSPPRPASSPRAPSSNLDA